MTYINKRMYLLNPYFLALIIMLNSCGGGGDVTPPPPDVDPIQEELSDTELMDLVQRNTFKYFWDFAHPVSGLALERSNLEAYGGEASNIVTTGGSGFGV